jgi:hypothetical protein
LLLFILILQALSTSWIAAKEQYLDLYSLSAHFHHINCSKDGVHILYHCNYRALVTQWDFNWLLALGVIVEYPDEAKITRNNPSAGITWHIAASTEDKQEEESYESSGPFDKYEEWDSDEFGKRISGVDAI